jgi:hypothetical protein
MTSEESARKRRRRAVLPQHDHATLYFNLTELAMVRVHWYSLRDRLIRNLLDRLPGCQGHIQGLDI